MDLLIQELEWGRRNNMLEDKDFELLEETPIQEEAIDEEVITDDDFELVQIDETVHEQKIQTKPTTFLKDSLKRFTKNKSSVVAAFILGILLILSFAVPASRTFQGKGDVASETNADETYLAPKLFNAGTGWWDGTVKYKKAAVDTSAMPDATTDEEKQLYWWPSKDVFKQRSAISKKEFTGQEYTNDYSSVGFYGTEGYIQICCYSNHKKDANIEYATTKIDELTLNNDLYLSVLDVYDAAKIKAREGKNELNTPENYELVESAFYFNYIDGSLPESDPNYGEYQEVKLVDYSIAHNIGSAVTSLSEPRLNIAEKIANETGLTTFKDAYFSLRFIADGKSNICSLVGGIAFESDSADETIKGYFNDMSFLDASKRVVKTVNDKYEYWSCTGDAKKIYLSKAYFCSFVYDTYEAAFGDRENPAFSILKLLDYEKQKLLTFKNNGVKTLWLEGTEVCVDTINFRCTILDAEKCPVAKPLQLDDIVFRSATPDSSGVIRAQISQVSARATITQYKFLGYDKMPRYLMGTDKNGRDMFVYVFEGLRTSLLLGVLTFIVCFLFGLLWGSICGYFGGTVDLLMERFTDILAGVPWIVVMTLVIIHLGSNFGTFALALCMTGWIGTAARTRTQFYRFRGREYVLASRTLGASDARLIAKHILPNALGTIITGAVLMIPSVIFSEATISYLGLGLKGMSSLGVILSNNQSELLTSPYLLIFPSVVIALIMISFNLFGNGLRDAINPSLKGED